jgi:phosphoglycerol transferase
MQTTKSKALRCLWAGLTFLCFTIAFLCLFAAAFYIDVFGRLGFDSILFTLTNGLDGTQSGMLANFLLKAVLPTLLCACAVTFLAFHPMKWKRKVPKILRSAICVILCLVLIVSAAFLVELPQYLLNQLQPSNLYEKAYVDPETVAISFPEEKRNLIYIYLESMETSFLDKDHGGAMDTCLIPELFQLADTYQNFSHNDTIGGMVEIPGATWTVGAMVAHSAGVPMIAPADLEDLCNGYGEDGVFLPGLTTIGDILHEEGYYQTLMVGSDADFGGRKTFYATHGTDKICDLYTAREDGIIAPNYFVWWGMEDLHLYEYAKQELTEMAQMDQPFAFTMLTVDTHHVGGYKCSLCGSDHEENYDNVYECASRQLAAFVQWIMAQSFYENTTIIITGDHFSMDSAYFERVAGEDYVRHGYNCFINSAVTATNTQNRLFTPLDMFPSTLAAMGCTIPGDRLGLGVNLFSQQKTLMEQYGYDAFRDEISKRTDYYENKFY